MRVAILGHSYVAQRQALFGAALTHELGQRGHTLLQYYPEKWGPHTRVGGLDTYGAGDQGNFTFTPEAWQRIREDDPHLVVLQQEPYCLVSFQVRALCARLNIPYIVFTWDNLLTPTGPGLDVLRDAAHVVAGNSDARHLVYEAADKHATILPQVGLDTELFAPPEGDFVPAYDVVFAGRPDPMKGADVLEQAAQGTSWKVLWGHRERHLTYPHMATRYHAAKLQCTPSRDVVGRPREQFAPYCSLEGALCGRPIVTTNQPAILEWLEGAPGVLHARQGDADHLRAHIAFTVDDDRWREGQARLLREWVAKRFSNDVVAAQWADLIQEYLPPKILTHK